MWHTSTRELAHQLGTSRSVFSFSLPKLFKDRTQRGLVFTSPGGSKVNKQMMDNPRLCLSAGPHLLRFLWRMPSPFSGSFHGPGNMFTLFKKCNAEASQPRQYPRLSARGGGGSVTSIFIETSLSSLSFRFVLTFLLQCGEGTTYPLRFPYLPGESLLGWTLYPLLESHVLQRCQHFHINTTIRVYSGCVLFVLFCFTSQCPHHWLRQRTGWGDFCFMVAEWLRRDERTLKVPYPLMTSSSVLLLIKQLSYVEVI